MRKETQMLVFVICTSVISFFLGALCSSLHEKKECLEQLQNAIRAEEVREKLKEDPSGKSALPYFQQLR